MATTNRTNSNYSFKIVLLGEGCVGKTSLLLRYIEDKFNDKHLTTIQVLIQLNIDVLVPLTFCCRSIDFLLMSWTFFKRFRIELTRKRFRIHQCHTNYWLIGKRFPIIDRVTYYLTSVIYHIFYCLFFDISLKNQLY